MLCNWRSSRIAQTLNHPKHYRFDLSRLNLCLVEELSWTQTKLQHLRFAYLASRVNHQGKFAQARLTA